MIHHRLALLAGIAGIALVGCVEPEPGAPVDEAAPVACGLPEDYEVLDTGHIVDGDIIVGTLAELEEDCAAGRAWRGPKAGRRGIGVIAGSLRWPGARVPFTIDPALPDQARITAAIAEWAAKTPIRLVAKTAADTDFVNFTNGSGCASSVGRQGGRQDIVLTTGKSATQIVGSSISRGDTVYTWFDDGMAAAGNSATLDSARAQYAYSLPPGYTPASIVGIGIAKSNDRVFAWYSDGRVSSGTSEDLDAHSAPVAYSLPPGKSIAQIVEIDISRNDRVFTWFSDGTVSIGTSTDLDAHQAPIAYVAAAGQTIAQLRGIGIAGSNDRVFAWYSDRRASTGTSNDLDVHAAAFDFDPPGHCGVSAVTHEIGHAIGLQHEQTRCDRNSFVRIFWDNISSGKSHNFEQHCNSTNLDLGAYNDTSIMHYSSGSFTSNGSPTILRLTGVGLAVPAASVIDMSIASTHQVYTWWSDGMVTAGGSEDLELHQSRYPFALPDGYAMTDIAGIGIAKSNDRVYTFFRDGRRSVGTSADLAAISNPVSYSLPPGYTTANIVAIDIASTDRVFTWYTDGRMSIGNSTDLDAHAGPAAYTLAPGRTPSTVLGIAIAPTDWVYAWYTSGSASAGTSTDLDSRRALFGFRQRLGLLSPSGVLNGGDVAAVDAMY